MDKVQKIIEETERRITRLDHACKHSERMELVSLLEFMKTVQREPDVVDGLIIIKPKKEKVNAADVIDQWCKEGQLTAKDIAKANARVNNILHNKEDQVGIASGLVKLAEFEQECLIKAMNGEKDVYDGFFSLIKDEEQLNKED